jgi:GT2 family glycosyltransferase
VASLTVAAVVISRGNSETLNQTLAALQNQTHSLQQVVVVETVGDHGCIELSKSYGFAAISSEARKQGEAIAAGITAFQGDPSWLWILHHDTAPEDKALAELSKAAEISPSVAVIGPKLLDWDGPIQIRQLGLTLTKTSRPFTLVEDEYDQGQFDATGDTLAVSTAGMLVAMGLWQKTGGIDDESPSYAQDIEFCIKARAMGFRVIVEPSARVRSAGSLTSNLHPAKKLFGGRAEALSKAHTHLATILWPGWLLPLLYLAMPLIAAASIPLNLVQKRPARILGQFSAWLFSWFTVGKRLAARRRVRSLGSLASLPQLYATREQVSERRARRFEEEPEPQTKALGIWESKSIWLSLIPLAVGFGLIPQGAIYAERLVPIGRSWDSIWTATASSTTQYLDGVSLPSDPFNWFFALVALIWPGMPSEGIGWFIFIAPALAFIGSWLLVSTVSDSAWVKNAIALSYSLAAPVLLLQRDALVVELVVFAFLPWTAYFLVKAALAFNLSRAWRWLGLAGLSGALIAISSPVIFAFLILLSLALGAQRVRRLGVLVWFLVPGLLLLAPWISFVIRNQAFEFLSVTSSSQAAPISLYEEPVWLYLLSSLAIIALAGSIFRLGLSVPLWVAALALLYSTGFQAVSGAVAQLIGLLLVLLVLVAIGLQAVNQQRLKVAGATLLILSALGLSVVFGSLQPRNFEFGVERSVPALVLASSDVDPGTRALVIDLQTGEIEVDYLWGDGRSQDEISVLYEFFRPEGEIDSQIAQLAGSLIAGNPSGVNELNQVLGVDFVLLVGEGELARQAGVALDSMTILQASGQTGFGQLWSFVERGSASQPQVESSPLRELQLLGLAAFALLAIPTPASITGRRRVRSAR